MLINRKYIKKTTNLSILIQLITGIITLNGLNIKVGKKDIILIDILKLESLVQFIELVFYIWMSQTDININTIASRRYIDWVITTPTMLLSTIMFMKYEELNEKNSNKYITSYNFVKEYKEDIKKILSYNLLMIIFGYLGEINKINKIYSISIGFCFFILCFNLIYNKFAKYSNKGKKLYKFLFIVWGMYGIAAMFPNIEKNISYNILDIIAKNFYGLYIYNEILNLRR
tara:strand:- start:393 stop:1079 length:687 start_codon:yes stop_codon:yes gene_type:complete